MLRTLRASYLLFFVIFIYGCATITHEEVTILKTGERLITVCVLNDALFPVAERLIGEALDEVFQEYRMFTNIVFKKEPTKMFYADITKQLFKEYAVNIWRNCNGSPGIKIVFSSRTLTVVHFPWVENKDAPPESSRWGVTINMWGVILLYSVAEQWYERDLKGNRTLITTLKHEIGHCFGLEHVPDKQSFMYSPANQSFGNWTKDIAIGIKKSYRKTWHTP